MSFAHSTWGEHAALHVGDSDFVKRGNLLTNKAAEDRFALPRNTHSASKSGQKAGGLAPILTKFPLNLQRAIKEHCLDYMSINAKLLTLEAKHIGEHPPTVLLETRDNLKEAKRRLRELAGPETSILLLDYLNSEEAQTGFVVTEDDAVTETEARIARRKLDKKIAFTGNRPIAQSTHNAASTKGRKSLWNETQVDNKSYYERLQDKYGKGRRGSTEHAGSAWDDVFAEADAESGAGAGAAPGGGDGGGVSAAAAAAAAHAARDRGGSGASFGSFGSGSSGGGAPAAGMGGGASGAGTYTMPTEAFLPSSAAAPAPASAAPPAVGGAYSASTMPVAPAPAPMPSPAAPRARRGSIDKKLGRKARPTAFNPAMAAALRTGGVGESFSSSAGGFSAAPSTFTKSSEIAKSSDTARQFSILRGTHSAAKAAAKVGGLAAVLATYPLNMQRAIREAALDILELEVRCHTLEERWEATYKEGDKVPAVIAATRQEYDDALTKLKELVHEDDLEALIACMRTEEVAEAMIATEDDAATVEEARVNRRKLNKFFPKGFNAGHTMTVHDATDGKGKRSAWNETDVDNRSYYEKQQERYGRGRSGSTGISNSSAWDEVFADPEGVADGAGDPAAVAAMAAASGDLDPAVAAAIREAQMGNPDRLAAIASGMVDDEPPPPLYDGR